MSNLVSSTSIFRIFDEAKAREFYVDYLGFEVAFEYRFSDAAPLYLGLVRDGVTLHLSEHHGDSTPGSAVRIQVDDIDAFHTSLSSKDYKFQNPGLETKPWAREVTVTDPFQNRIVFFSPLSSA